VLRANGETGIMQENTDWLEVDEGHPGFQLLTKKQIAAVIFIYYHQQYLYY
jgi:hypothetical protein